MGGTTLHRRANRARFPALAGIEGMQLAATNDEAGFPRIMRGDERESSLQSMRMSRFPRARGDERKYGSNS